MELWGRKRKALVLAVERRGSERGTVGQRAVTLEARAAKRSCARTRRACACGEQRVLTGALAVAKGGDASA